MSETRIVVHAFVDASPAETWFEWNSPEAITVWNHASHDWHCPSAENDLRVGGTFSYRMAAKDGSASFDFGGTYTEVTPHQRIAYVLGDDRKVEVEFKPDDGGTLVTERFTAEDGHSAEMQRAGWQAILDTFATYMASPR